MKFMWSYIKTVTMYTNGIKIVKHLSASTARQTLAYAPSSSSLAVPNSLSALGNAASSPWTVWSARPQENAVVKQYHNALQLTLFVTKWELIPSVMFVKLLIGMI